MSKGWGTAASTNNSKSNLNARPPSNPSLSSDNSNSARHATGGANSWAHRSGSAQSSQGSPSSSASPSYQARGNYGNSNRSDENRTFADDVLDAGNEAIEAYYDSLKEREAVNPEVTTGRMLKLARETEDVADASIYGLEMQKDALTHEQHEIADLRDEQIITNKKMNSIKSGWGSWSNIGSKGNHHHNKELEKKELNDAKAKNQSEREEQRAAYARNQAQLKDTEDLIHQTTGDLRKEQRQAKKDSRVEVKNIDKNRAEQRDGTVNYGGFVFEERKEGPKHQSEKDLEALAEHTKSFREKSARIGTLVDETNNQIDWLQKEVREVDEANKDLNYKMNRYVKKHG